MFDHIRHLPQIEPCRAKQKFDNPEDMVDYFDTEQKIDGERYLLHTHVPANGFVHAITSRCESVQTKRFVEKTDRIPHITTNYLDLPEATIFDCEAVSTADEVLIELPGKYWDPLQDKDHPHMKWFMKQYGGSLPIYPHVSHTTKILGSLADEAVRKQEEGGWIRLNVFDMLQWCRRDLKLSPQSSRRACLAGVLDGVEPGNILLMPSWTGLCHDDLVELFYRITDAEGEGLVQKDPVQPYNAARNWYKVKRYWPVDVVTTGAVKIGEHGVTGKMLGKVSAVSVGVYSGSGNRLFHVGWVSAIMDGMHNVEELTEAHQNGTLRGRVWEIHHNGLQNSKDAPLGYTLRHPRFSRRRPDKSAAACTSEALLAEVKKSSK